MAALPPYKFNIITFSSNAKEISNLCYVFKHRPTKFKTKICLNKHYQLRSLGQPMAYGTVSQQGEAGQCL